MIIVHLITFQDLKHILPNASTRDVPPWVTLGRRKVYYILGRSAGGAVPQTARQQEDERINSVDNQTHALEARCVVRRASRICSTFGRLRIRRGQERKREPEYGDRASRVPDGGPSVRN